MDPTDRDLAEKLADALDQFFYDLRYTAPEAVGQRLNELGARVADPMKALGYPKERGA
jgi:hypothetical protein